MIISFLFTNFVCLILPFFQRTHAVVKLLLSCKSMVVENVILNVNFPSDFIHKECFILCYHRVLINSDFMPSHFLYFTRAQGDTPPPPPSAPRAQTAVTSNDSEGLFTLFFDRAKLVSLQNILKVFICRLSTILFNFLYKLLLAAHWFDYLCQR